MANVLTFLGVILGTMLIHLIFWKKNLKTLQSKVQTEVQTEVHNYIQMWMQMDKTKKDFFPDDK